MDYTLKSGSTHLFRTNSKKIEISNKKGIFSKMWMAAILELCMEETSK